MISSTEMARIRRQMQRRIRDVVAERRRARQDQLSAGPIDAETAATEGAAADPSLVCSG